MPIDLFHAVATLQADWPTLPDVDKAEAIARILSAGMKKRTLAAALKCSEGLIRHLEVAATATAADKALARERRISTHELVRRARARRSRRTDLHRQAEERDRTAAAQRGSDDILAWISSERLHARYAERIVAEAEGQLFLAEQTGGLPKERAPEGTSVREIIARCKPASLADEETNVVAGYARWLALWAFHAMPEAAVRDGAFKLAKSVLARRS